MGLGLSEAFPHQTLGFLFGRYRRLLLSQVGGCLTIVSNSRCRHSESHSLVIHTVFLHRMSVCHSTLVHLGIARPIGFVQLAREC